MRPFRDHFLLLSPSTATLNLTKLTPSLAVIARISSHGAIVPEKEIESELLCLQQRLLVQQKEEKEIPLQPLRLRTFECNEIRGLFTPSDSESVRNGIS